MKIYITADWHLAEGAWKSRPEIAGDAFESLKKLISNSATGDVILAAGDLFDTKQPSAATVNQACKLLRSGKGTVPYVCFIQGQHEFADVPWLNEADAEHADFKQRLKAGLEPQLKLWKQSGITIWAMDWTLSLHLQKNLDELDVLFANYKRANPKSYNILMLHQTCNAVMAGTGEDRNSILDGLDFRACELKDHMLPHGFDICIVGDTHYHTEFMLYDKKGGRVRCLSPGSFAMQSVSETNTGQCFVLDCETMKVSSQPLYRREYREVKIDNAVDWDQEIRDVIKLPKAANQLSMPIVRYTVYENDADRIAALKQACVGKIHPFFNVLFAEIEDAEVNIGKTENVDELIQHAIQEYDASDEAKELLVSLLQNNSPDETLNEYYKEMVLR